jgi:hypothetical protein
MRTIGSPYAEPTTMQKPDVDNKCEVCGAPTKVFRSSRRVQRWCSKECYSKGRSQQGKWLVWCKWCGLSRRVSSRAAGCWCSKRSAIVKCKCGRMKNPTSKGCDECWASTKRRARFATAIGDGCLQWLTGWRSCKECGQLNVRRARCEECAKERARRDSRTLPDDYKPSCRKCGKRFERRSKTKPGVLCDTCRVEEHHENRRRYRRKSRRINGRKCNHRQRARAFGVAYEPIKTREVFERDKYRCQLCNRMTDRTKRGPHPRSPSLDHIVPLSKGGGHVWGNVQCACFECNTRKSNRVEQETQLVLC